MRFLVLILLLLCLAGCAGEPQLPMKLTTRGDLQSEVERVSAPLPPRKVELFKDAILKLGSEVIRKHNAAGKEEFDKAIVAIFDGKTPDQVIAEAKRK
jgi:hypothetical protein